MERFSEGEARDIFRRAVQMPRNEYTSEELQRSAVEMGISAESLARAEAEVREERTRKEFDLHLKRRAKDEIVQFVTTMVALTAINLFTSPHYLWVLWVAPWWGLSSIGTIRKTYDREGDGYHRAFDRWQRKTGRFPEGDLSDLVKG